MSERVTREQFYGAIPRYFERADSATTRIFDRAVANPASSVQIQAAIHGSDPPDYKKWISNPEQLAKLWRTGQWGALDADVPLDNMRLGLEVTKTIRKQIRAWLYTVPVSLSPDEIMNTMDGKPEELPDKTEIDWISHAARRRLGNLAMPGYLFFGAEGYADKRPHILSYVYSTHDVEWGRHEFSGASGVGGDEQETLMNALAPPLSEQDIRLLEQGIETYHTAKIERLLGIMEAIARKGV